MGVGRADARGGRDAGAHACAAALRGADPELLVVFAARDADLPALLAGIQDAAPGVPLIGCSTAGEIAANGAGDGGVVVMAFGGPGFDAATGVALGAAGRLRDAGAEAATAALTVAPRKHRALILLTDGLAGDQQEIVRGAYSVAGASVPLVGGGAGDGLRLSCTAQLHGDRVLEGAVVAAVLASDAPLGIGVRHGWQRVGEPALVTESRGNRVHRLEDRPALDVYLERLDAPPAARVDPDAFKAFALTHPLGMSRRRGEDQARFVGDADFGDRSLGSFAVVPQGGLAWFLQGSDASVLDATDAACRDALAGLEGRPPLGLLAFDCISRRLVLGDDGMGAEVERIAAHAGGAPVAGFYTYGEFARVQGVNGLHNQTLVVLAVA